MSEKTVRPRARRTAPTRPAISPASQATFLLKLEAQLATAALSAGLGRLRPRSLPSRLPHEARGFVRFLAVALRAPSDRALDRAANTEVRTGAFALAGVEEADRVLSLWRQTLRSLPDRVPPGNLDRAFERMRHSVVAACQRVAGDRIDVVAIGASAGGIQAVGALLADLDELTAASLLLVLHTHPTSPSLMPLVLSKFTAVPITFPADGGLPLLGTVYVAPPGRHLGVEGDRLRLLDRPPVRFSRPSIDVLFETAAQTYGPRLASVVLTGTGRDGADGTVAVSRHGGLTFAQDPETAEFGTMPRSAIQTGAVRHVATLDRLRDLLGRLISDGVGAVESELS